MRHYYKNIRVRKSKDHFQHGTIVRATPGIYGDEGHKGMFMAKRENFFNSKVRIKGSWLSDDGRK